MPSDPRPCKFCGEPGTIEIMPEDLATFWWICDKDECAVKSEAYEQALRDARG